ncbi:ATP-binding protein [Rhodobacter sp. KR11]|uniref:ATP-binding protein n=1 Tax=Rhodobacter sp. KR11 TaxID=2974588 RepID=UPI002221DA8A|nr:ATP-binding protein [Rhodobacter sp. KR11]MCW1918032.1 ATP-binding protein [Rhodobacter sp. KR11]
MLESLRGLGYTTSTAIADIVDNSISAGASLVDIRFEWADAQSFVRITDDGLGMDDPELESALRLGAKDPRDSRSKDDLGRFGMGLKTATFSQARRLTVATRKAGGAIACLRWDLDRIHEGEAGQWPLFEGPEAGSEPRIAALDTMEQGTIVLWETLDRIVTQGFKPTDLADLVEQVDSHLAMTFHRLIGPRLTILLNGRKVQPWDPFLLGHASKRWESDEYRLAGAPDVLVQCHVLPHRDFFPKPEVYDKAGGPAGWTSQQGFYVYRNERLLLPGTWLRLGERGKAWTKDEPHRLARIRLDIPNTADAEWKIDILKSTAAPPVRLREQLARLARETREKARDVFAFRGGRAASAPSTSGALPDVWNARALAQGTTYRIARDHDLVASILDRAGPMRDEILSLLRLIEETVPVQRIWLDTAEDKEIPRNGFSAAPDKEVLETLETMFDVLVRHRGLSEDEARSRLAKTKPFDAFPALVGQLALKD